MHSHINGAVTGFVTSIGIGEIFGFLNLANISQAFVLGMVGAVGGYLGKIGIIYIINKIKN